MVNVNSEIYKKFEKLFEERHRHKPRIAHGAKHDVFRYRQEEIEYEWFVLGHAAWIESLSEETN